MDLYTQIVNLKDSFLLIAGPCVIEDYETTYKIAQELKNISLELNLLFIFKASYKKANRTNINSFTGIGDLKALKVLKEIKEKLGLYVLTDIHSPEEANLVKNYVDIIQIPAFLCRQTELLLAAGNTGLIVNIKKGQFASPYTMKFAAEKVKFTGNNRIMLTERGTMFGYYDLIVDFRSIPIMQSFGYPVIVDVSHSLQIPNTPSGYSLGTNSYTELLAKASISVGANGIFIETHPTPSKALSDSQTMFSLHEIKPLLLKLLKIKKSLE